MAQTATSIEFVRPPLYRKQFESIYAPERYSVVEASTKSGKTVGCMVWLSEQAWLGKAGWEYWWVAPVFDQAAIVFRRLKRGLTQGTFTANESNMSITLMNRAVLRFKSADKPDSLYGEDVHAAVIDEATRVKEEAWHAVRSTLTATRGPIRIIGNVKGRKNWAYRLARRAESGDPEMHYARITAWDAVSAGVLEEREVRDAQAVFPEAVFKELYEAEASDDQGNPFGYGAIRNCIRQLSTKKPFAWCWDLARSNDWTVGIALDEDGNTCEFERWNQAEMPSTVVANPRPGESNEAYWALTLRRVRDRTGQTAAYVDSTGPGGPIDQALSAGGLRNIEGYVFSQRSKQMLMEGLAVAIQAQEIGYPEGPIVNELESFEYTYTATGVKYSAPDGLHDDCVVALALARARWLAQKQRQRVTLDMLALMEAPVPIEHGSAPERRRSVNLLGLLEPDQIDWEKSKTHYEDVMMGLADDE